jgi:uncharacterized protein (TIGR00725 family)
VVGVMGSSQEPHAERATPLGRRLAELGVHLLTGGGPGAMEAVSRAFAETPGRRGLVLGILPGLPESGGGAPHAPPGYPNRFVDLALRTHLPALGERGGDPDSRNHLNVLTSDAIVALPGGPGTASEVALAVAYGKPVVAYRGRRDEIAGLPPAVPVESDLERVLAFVREHLPQASPPVATLPPIRCRTFVARPPDEVFDLLSTGDGWSRWFTTEARFEARAGGRYSLYWKDFGGDRTTIRLEGQVREAVRPRRLAFDWESGGGVSTVRLELEPRGAGTMVTVTEEGYDTTAEAVSAALVCAGGWGEALTLLKFHAEHGVRYGPVPPE